MNKVIIAALGAAAALTVTIGCSKKNALVPPTNAADSVAMIQGYLTGQQLTQQFMMSAMQGAPIDSEAFLKGFREGIQDTAKFSYYLGQFQAAQMAMGLAQQDLNVNIFAAYLEAAIHGDSTVFTMPQADAYAFMQSYMEKKRTEEMKKEFGENEEAGKKALAEFAKEEGVQMTESGIAYKYLAHGTGKTPTEADQVKVNYVGKLVNGEEFDASKEEPATFGVTGVIPGWTELLKLMKEGDHILAYIPQELAYGSRDMGNIKPLSTLIFDMTLVEVITPKSAN